MKTIIFQLTMPGVGSWNGRWSGEREVFAIIKRLPDPRATDLDGKSFGYRWEDGWAANISCRISKSAAETRKVRKLSRGFCGYDWMVRSILKKDCIETE